MIKVKIETKEEFFDSFEFKEGEDTPENREYLLGIWRKIVENEEECLEDLINQADDSFGQARIVRDNMGSNEICNEFGDTLGTLDYWTDVTL